MVVPGDPGNGAIRVAVSGGHILGGSDVRSATQWHHVAAVLPEGASDVSEVELYVDGVLETGTTSSGQTIDTAVSANVTIGAFMGGGFFDGLIDDVRIYSRGLSAGEIWELAN